MNEKNSSSAKVETVVPQSTILDPLLFLIYISDLSHNLSPNLKLFTCDTSLFFVVHDMATSSCDWNNDLNKVKKMGISMGNEL